jgi:hypothetical protein
MCKTPRTRLALCWLIAFAAYLTPIQSLGATATATQTLRVNMGAIGKLAVVPSNVSLAHTGVIFENFAGAVTVQYRVRTMVSTGSSFITLRAASDFSPANGPSIAGADLTYACSGATVGTACSGSQTVSISSQTNVVSVGSGVCTGDGCGGASPNSVTVNLNLVDSPVFKSGSYSTTLTFSISAL